MSMADVPYFFKSPDVPKLKTIVAFYEQGKLQNALPDRNDMEQWSDEITEALADKAGEFIREHRAG